MTLNIIKEKLHQYLESGDPRKVKAFYAMVEDEIMDADFEKELDKRAYEMENNLVKTYSLDEMIREARRKTKKKLKSGNKNTSKSK